MKIKLFIKKSLLAIICFTMFHGVFAQWNQFRGPNRDGFSEETGFLKEWPFNGPKLVWSVNGLGEGFSSAAIEDNMIYLTGKKDSLEVLTGINSEGELVWQTVIGSASKMEWPESRGTTTAYKGKVYATSVVGDVVCADGKTGKIEWTKPVYRDYQGVSSYNLYGESPLVVDDKVIITPCGSKTTMVALDRMSGDLIWKTESLQDTSVFTSPMLFEKNGKRLVVTTLSHNTIGVDLSDGKILWKINHCQGIVPLPHKNQMYANGYADRGKMYRIKDDMSDCEALWEDTVSGNYMGGCVRSGDKLIISGNDRSGNSKGLISVDWKTGKVLGVNKEIKSSTMITMEDMLISYEETRGRVSLVKVNDNSLDLISSFRIKEGQGPHLAHLSIANGLLYVRHGDLLFVYDLKHS